MTPKPIDHEPLGLDSLTNALGDPRLHPDAEALRQLGASVMTEVLDVVLETALENHLRTICETRSGGFHAGSSPSRARLTGARRPCPAAARLRRQRGGRH